ncbi:translocation/assembly module TamB domain-containing protein [Glaesserella sp.]|uniref:autotransporter assembly complex protein TamB n=1 Tax=Glaesserella sp. TaxID=2094731 RepID=UPI0035A09ACF
MEQQVVHQTETDKDNKDVSAPSAPNKPKATKWRCVRRLLFILLIIIVCPFIFLATGFGQRTVLELADKWLEPLTIGKVEGSLQDGLRLSDTRFKTDGVDVSLGQADLHIGFGCLLKGSTCVENMALKNAVVNIDTSKLPPSQPEQEAQAGGEFNLPLEVMLKRLSLDDLTVKVDDMDIRLHHFHSGITGYGKDVTLLPTKLDGLSLSLAPQAVSSEQKNANSAEIPKQSIDWAAIKQQLSQPLLTKLDPIKLPLNIHVPEFSATRIGIEQKVIATQGDSHTKSLVNVSDIDLVAKSDAQSITLSRLEIKSDKGNVSGTGSLMLSGDYPLDWTIHAETLTFPEFNLPESGFDLKLSGELFKSTALTLQTSGAVAADIQASAQLAEPKTPFHLTVKSDQITYPFTPEKGMEPLTLQKVNVVLSGDLLNYHLNTNVNAKGMNLPASSLALQGKGELTQFELSDLTLNALQGKTNIIGKVDWANGVEWQSSVNLNNIHTQSLLPEWAAVLSGGLKTEGYTARGEKGNEWSVSVSEMDIHGNLFQKNLRLKGELTANHKTLLNIPGASLNYGENTIGLKGVIGDKSDFTAEINAPNLQGLMPSLQASVNGKVKLSGNINQPDLDLDLTANHVGYQELALQHLTAKGKITTEKQIQGNLEIDLNQLNYGDVHLQHANLVASGSEANHTVKLTSKGEPVGADLQLSGTFNRAQQTWKGQLSNVSVQSPVGEWKNDKTVQLTYLHSQTKAEISAHCWANPKLNVCFPQTFSAGKEGHVPFEIRQFDLAMIQEYLSEETKVTGIVNAKGDAAWFSSRAPQVNVELTSDKITLNQKIDYRTFPLTLTPIKITANMADNNLKLNTDIKIENNGRLSSELLMKDLANTRGLSGNINIDKINLGLASPLLSNGDKVDGDINARLTLGGTALSPLLHGNLNLTGLKANSTIMPFDVTGGNLAILFNGASSTLKGNMQTKESNLLLEGDANWQKLDAWYTRIHAQANRFRVDMPNMAKVDISPNIEVKATPKELILGGNIDIPWARIAVEELPESAVSVSDDEIIMDGSAKNKTKHKFDTLPQQNSSGMAIKADVSINIGNDVKLEAYGLKTNLEGLIKVRQGNKGLGLYGQVNLKNGTFASFGQDLIIRKGLISFTGLPTQPTLDFEAIRNPEAMEDSSVTAGVRVTGIADAPEVKIFSTPSLPQDQALSYILTGRGLESSGDAGSSNSIAAALVGMSLSKSSKAVGSVGSAFGITDLNVSTAGIGDNTKVEVSGSLTPKFKVKYGVGIFAPLTELTLRYRLAPSLYLQWVSSVNQAVDLMYRFEFD